MSALQEWWRGNEQGEAILALSRSIPIPKSDQTTYDHQHERQQSMTKRKRIPKQEASSTTSIQLYQHGSRNEGSSSAYIAWQVSVQAFVFSSRVMVDDTTGMALTSHRFNRKLSYKLSFV